MRLEELPGLSPDLRSRLEAIGIVTSQQLLRAAQRGEQLLSLIKATGLPAQALQAGVQKAALTQIRGVGPAVLEQLFRAGIESLEALAALEPQQLQARLQRVTTPGRPPNLAVIEDWIRQARLKGGR